MEAGDPRIESLEPRVLLSSAVLKDKKLTVRGDANSPNTITLSLDKGKNKVMVDLNGTMYTFKKDNVDRITVVGGNLADLLQVDQTVVKFSIYTRWLGNGGDDTIIAGKEHDLIFGDDGNDTIYSGDGTDTIVGGNGNDTIICGNGQKVIFGGPGDDIITAGTGQGYIFGEDGNDTITTGDARFEVFGNAGNDTLNGHGRDTLWGGPGADVLSGGTEDHEGDPPQVSKIMHELRPKRPDVMPDSA
jgi:Ca2+-binding RTX toxin-like protein